MRILLAASTFDSLTQRLHAELGDLGHDTAVLLTRSADALREAIPRHSPDLILTPGGEPVPPFDVRSTHTCLTLRSGPVGERGPSALDWALHEGLTHWGVHVLQPDARPDAEPDTGAVWAYTPHPLPPVTRGELYRGEIADAACTAMLTAVARFAGGRRPHRPHATSSAPQPRPPFPERLRRIRWEHDDTATVLRRLRAADPRPGVPDDLLGGGWYLHGGHPENRLTGPPGTLLATRDGAICRATTDGAVWIPELRPRVADGSPGWRLPAVTALGDRLPPLPKAPSPDIGDGGHTWSAVRYAETGPVGVLSFPFPGGALDTGACRRLLAAYREACARPTTVLVLAGRRDLFSTGVHPGTIEAAPDPAAESWANITAFDDLVEAVLTTTDRLVVAAVGGVAAAGGALLALAADEVWCRRGALLTPSHRRIGLPGSAYWTHTLPRRAGSAMARRLMTDGAPVSAPTGRRIGLVDRIVDRPPEGFAAEVLRLAGRLAESPSTADRVGAKKAALERREAVSPLAAHRAAEHARTREAVFDPDSPYHALRRALLRGEPGPGTPVGPGLTPRTTPLWERRTRRDGP